ncbi:MAG: cation transporter dimerization domain-containing protein, partial [Burkholderiales bacterium]
VLILRSTWLLLKASTRVLMEGVPAHLSYDEIGGALTRVPGVSAVHDLHVWSIGSARAALSAHVEIGQLEEWPTILRASQDMLRQRFAVDHVTLQPELALKRPAHAIVTMWPRGQKPS